MFEERATFTLNSFALVNEVLLNTTSVFACFRNRSVSESGGVAAFEIRGFGNVGNDCLYFGARVNVGLAGVTLGLQPCEKLLG